MVFNYINAEVGRRIFDLLLRNVVNRVEREYRAEFSLALDVRERLTTLAVSNPELGGRGIGSVIESVLVNPLARSIFRRQPAPGECIEVTALNQIGSNWEVELS